MKKLCVVVGLVIALFSVRAAAAGPIDLAGTAWGFSKEIGNFARFLEFRSDGKVSGSTGCNRFTGTYSQDGVVVTLGILATTRRACLPEAMKREQQFLDLLSKIRSAEGSHLRLILKDAKGDVLAELVRRDLKE
jgi:heat shock protein HslJ